MGQCVMTTGTMKMLLSFAINWDSLLMVLFIIFLTAFHLSFTFFVCMCSSYLFPNVAQYFNVSAWSLLAINDMFVYKRCCCSTGWYI